MPYFPISLPPGVYRNGTEYQSKGRWYDANLCRFYQGSIRPIGGWRTISTSTMTGSPRSIITWSDNSVVKRAAIGTNSHLYAMSSTGVLQDITPSGFVAGLADSTVLGGYGTLNYGKGIYGAGRTTVDVTTPAMVWSLDTFGQYLEACPGQAGTIYEWQLGGASLAVAVTNAPTAYAIVVTEERFLFALGAGGNPRKVQWSDQEDNTTWTPAATNQAGSFNLQTVGKLQCGKRAKSATLLFTDVDVHRATYIGGTLVYSFEKLGSGCGAISQGCVGSEGGLVVWMGRKSFWMYDGFVKPLPCDVADYVFSNLNDLQRAKVTLAYDSAFSEFTWYYPSSGSTEIDSYVKWNALENHWNIGQLVRLAGVNRDPFHYPLMVGSDGNVYEHEVGALSGTAPYVQSGPIEIAEGDRVTDILNYIPDEKTLGDVNITLASKFYPNSTETITGPFSAADPCNLRITGRQIKVKFTGTLNGSDWRIGAPRLDVRPGSMR